MRIALDSNFLLYAEGTNDAKRRDIARDIARRLPFRESFVPVQALGEVFRVLTRKAGYSAEIARATILNMRDIYCPLETTESTLLAAMDLVANHQFTIWNAIILSRAAEANCRVLISEDIQDGFVWRGLTIVNPFSAKRHPLLEAALS